MTRNQWNRFRPRRGSMKRRRLSAAVTAAGWLSAGGYILYCALTAAAHKDAILMWAVFAAWLFTVCEHAARRER